MTAAQEGPLDHAPQALFDFRPKAHTPTLCAFRPSRGCSSRLELPPPPAPAGGLKLENHAHTAGGRGDGSPVGFQHELPDGLAVVVGTDTIGASGRGGDDGIVEPPGEEVAQGHARGSVSRGGGAAAAAAAGRC